MPPAPADHWLLGAPLSSSLEPCPSRSPVCGCGLRPAQGVEGSGGSRPPGAPMVSHACAAKAEGSCHFAGARAQDLGRRTQPLDPAPCFFLTGRGCPRPPRKLRASSQGHSSCLGPAPVACASSFPFRPPTPEPAAVLLPPGAVSPTHGRPGAPSSARPLLSSPPPTRPAAPAPSRPCLSRPLPQDAHPWSSPRTFYSCPLARTRPQQEGGFLAALVACGRGTLPVSPPPASQVP